MPEGDTIHAAARRVGAALVGADLLGVETPQRRHSLDRWPERLGGRAVRSVDAHGKHLFLRFEGGLTLHSHLRMGGMWGVYAKGRRWRRSARRAWLVLRTPAHDVVQFDGPVLELLTEGRSRLTAARLGPDVLAPEFDPREALRRIREDDPTRGIGDALLDQRSVAGIGNIWKSESCFGAGLDPWRPLAEVPDEKILALLGVAAERMRESLERYGGHPRDIAVYERADRPCPRCGTPVRARGQGDDNRTTWWCPGCQR